MTTVAVEPFELDHAHHVARLCRAVQWPSLTDPRVVARICTAPGASSYVALGEGPQGTTVVGWAQALSDGVLQAHLSFVAVHPDHRRRGIARLLTMATFQATGAKRLDLVTDDAAAGFYEAFPHRRSAGFRLWPGGAPD